MSRIILLDAGPLGLLSQPRPTPMSLACRQWAANLRTAGAHLHELTDEQIKYLHLQRRWSPTRIAESRGVRGRKQVRLEQRAHAAAQSVDAVIIRMLASSLSPAPEPDPPQAVQDELAAMEHLSDEALWAIARSTMNNDSLALYDLLRDRKEEGSLTPEGQQWLARLALDADALALRKAHAYALLKSRGHQLPALAELPIPTL